MPKSFKMDAAERKYGEKRIISMVNRNGQSAVARKFGVSQSTVSAWLKRKQYTRRYLWVKTGSEVA